MASPSPSRSPKPQSQGQPGQRAPRVLSCLLCQQRKVRCDKRYPCQNCLKAGVECQTVVPQPRRKRRPQPDVKDLLSRLKTYEALLTKHGIKFDADEIEAGSERAEHDATPPTDGSESIISKNNKLTSATPKKAIKDENTTSGPDDVQFKQAIRLLEGDNFDLSQARTSIQNAWDRAFGSYDGFPFSVGGWERVSLIDQHPSSVQIFQLWQTFLTNVDPLIKISHTGELQKQIIEASANLSGISRELEALMFNTYLMAVYSMTDEEAHAIFKQERNTLLRAFYRASEQALLNAAFMQRPTVALIQAFLLHLFCARTMSAPRALYPLVGIALRMAQALGLHRDGTLSDLPPFEVEQRRRLWWNLVIYERRVAETAGYPATALSTPLTDCRRPLNINDSELHIGAKTAPTPSQLPTDMIFVLTRIEVSANMLPSGADTSLPMPIKPTPEDQPSSSAHPAFSDVLPKSMKQSRSTIDSFCANVEKSLLANCDMNRPLHLFTTLLTEETLCKLHLIKNLSRAVKAAAGTPGSLSAGDRDFLFREAIRMLEFDNLIHKSDLCRPFLWYMTMFFPMAAYMFLINELRNNFTGDLCERAWAAMAENHEVRGLNTMLHSPMHLAYGRHFLKVWEARQAAHHRLGATLATPEFIWILRERAACPECSGNFTKDGSNKTRGSWFDGSHPHSLRNQHDSGHHHHHQHEHVRHAGHPLARGIVGAPPSTQTNAHESLPDAAQLTSDFASLAQNPSLDNTSLLPVQPTPISLGLTGGGILPADLDLFEADFDAYMWGYRQGCGDLDPGMMELS